MPRKTDGAKIDELQIVVAALTEQVRVAVRDLLASETAQVEALRLFNDFRREAEREIALLKREIEELKRDRERWGSRAWMVLAPLLAAAAGVAVGVKR